MDWQIDRGRSTIIVYSVLHTRSSGTNYPEDHRLVSANRSVVVRDSFSTRQSFNIRLIEERPDRILHTIVPGMRMEAVMKVRDVMSSGVLVAKKSDTVRSVNVQMINRHCGAIPVVGEEGELLGIVSVRDIMLPLYPNLGDYIHDNVHSRDFSEMERGYKEVLDKSVGSIMTTAPLTVGPDDPILEAASYMGLKNFRRIPVVEKGKLVGMVSVGDINRGLFFSL